MIDYVVTKLQNQSYNSNNLDKSYESYIEYNPFLQYRFNPLSWSYKYQLLIILIVLIIISLCNSLL